MNRHCISYACAQKPELRQTGWAGPEWYCPICKLEYYLDENENLLRERPSKWPAAKKIVIEKYEIKNGGWAKVTA